MGLSRQQATGLASWIRITPYILRLQYKPMAINLFRELKRRKVVRVMVVYSIVGYGVIEVADTVLPTLGIPDWGATFVTVLVLLGFPLALVLSWMLDVTPEGIERTRPTAPDAPPAVSAVTDGAEADGGGADVPAGTSQPQAPVRAAAPLTSIAVLPFANMSDSSDNELGTRETFRD